MVEMTPAMKAAALIGTDELHLRRTIQAHNNVPKAVVRAVEQYIKSVDEYVGLEAADDSAD